MLIPGITAAAPSAPVANFYANRTYGAAPLQVLFTDASSNNPTGWAWYFSDETYTAYWPQVNASSGWTGRDYHSSVVLPDGSIVLMGGTGASIFNDVWRSTDKGVTWTRMTGLTGAEWSARYGHTSVALPDGSIVLMGGWDIGGYPLNDVWLSTDNGATWTQQTAGAGWTTRYGHTSVVLPDSSIVLMGGYNGVSVLRDVWRSTDKGATWGRMTETAAWMADTGYIRSRGGFSSVALPDGSINGSIIVMGGQGYLGVHLNDVWRSQDKGVTWTQVTGINGAEWTGRHAHSSVVMPDGSIVLMGGIGASIFNDVWRSTDYGATWVKVNENAGWTARYGHSSVVLPDGRIVLMGGYVPYSGLKNDVYRLLTAGSSAQNPMHTFSFTGTYNVVLQAYNAGGYNSTRKTGYITVHGVLPSSRIGVVRNNQTWILDASGNGAYGAGDFVYNYGKAGDRYVTGDWNGDGTTEIGLVRNNKTWVLDASGNGVYGAGDLTYTFGTVGDVYVTGDWNGNGTTKIGVVRNNNTWLLDASGDGKFGPGDYQYVYGRAGDMYVTGDWNDDRKTEIGVVRNNTTWILDASGNGKYGAGDIVYNYGIAGDGYVTGDWTGSGTTKIGLVRSNTTWLLDASGNGLWGPGDYPYTFGKAGDKYVTGKWS